MIFSRRQLLGAVASTGLCATMAQGATLAEVVASLKDESLSPGPRAPAAFRSSAGLDPRLLARARAAFERHRWRLDNHDVIAITDFSKASRDARFFLLDTASGRLTRHLVAHGRGSDPDHSGFLEHFSNRVGSEASSAGGYVTGDYYYGKYGRSLRLAGLDRSNNNAQARAIVVHSAWYAEPDMVALHGKLGRSEGCFALSHDSLREVLARLGPGHFLYADKLA